MLIIHAFLGHSCWLHLMKNLHYKIIYQNILSLCYINTITYSQGNEKLMSIMKRNSGEVFWEKKVLELFGSQDIVWNTSFFFPTTLGTKNIKFRTILDTEWHQHVGKFILSGTKEKVKKFLTNKRHSLYFEVYCGDARIFILIKRPMDTEGSWWWRHERTLIPL